MRILGKSDTIDVDCIQLVMINGVNIRVANDLASRALHMYIDPRMENPENRNFKRQGLIDDARRDRAELLAACFTIAIAYSRAGCPIDSLRLAWVQ